MTNKQEYINFIKSIYPNMIEDFWFNTGELQFFKNEEHENIGEPYTCIRKNGQFKILKEF